MRTITAVEAQSDLGSVLDSAQRERILVVRKGKPVAMIVGVEGYDAEDLALAGSKEFWEMIEQRRRGPSVPLSEVKSRLKLESPPRQSSRSNEKGSASRSQARRPKRKS